MMILVSILLIVSTNQQIDFSDVLNLTISAIALYDINLVLSSLLMKDFESKLDYRAKILYQ